MWMKGRGYIQYFEIFQIKLNYCAPTFICDGGNFVRFMRTSPSRIFLVSSHIMFYAVPTCF
jgi:hypothetical protein